jgi:hypothetical protein
MIFAKKRVNSVSSFYVTKKMSFNRQKKPLFCLKIEYYQFLSETKKGLKMSEFNLKKLDYSPEQNPFACGTLVPIKNKLVKSSYKPEGLVNIETGEVVGASMIHSIERVDSDHFVKIFSAGIAASYELTKTGQRVFQAVLKIYENAPMSGGFIDAVYLAWFDNGLSGEKLEMSEKTFQRGLKELLILGFISPKAPNIFWVNPALFFRGDRVSFLKEYTRQSVPRPIQHTKPVDVVLAPPKQSEPSSIPFKEPLKPQQKILTKTQTKKLARFKRK